MHVLVNGTEKEIADESSIADLLSSFGISYENAVVEHNLTALTKSDYKTTMLSPGDRVEIICFVGGG